MPRLTLPIQAKTVQSAIAQVEQYASQVDAFELWLDHLAPKFRTESAVTNLVQQVCAIKPVLAVCKNPTERGQFTGSDKQKVDLLITALNAGSTWVDVGLHTESKEILRLSRSVKKTKSRSASKLPALIISHHDFKKTPNAMRLLTLVKRMKSHGVDIIKIATLVNTIIDNNTLINLAEHLTSIGQRHIIIGMGQLGTVTRIMSTHMGNEINFASAQAKTAPGQLSIEQAKSFTEILK